MQSILISFAITFIGVIAAVLLFSVAMRGRKEDEEPKPSSKAPTGKGQFFLNDGAGSEPVGELSADGLPLEVERHVRLEHEAAEGFARSPNADTLQAPSVSDLRRKKGP